MFAWSPESGKCLPVESRIRENFACEAGIREEVTCGIRNPGIWNPKSSSRKLESQ